MTSENEKDTKVTRERFHSGHEMSGRGLSLIDCVISGYARSAKRHLEKDETDVNYQDFRGMTALHYAAALGARQCLRVLVNSGRCNYLLKDNLGRYASELAFSCAKDYAVGVLLSKKQVKQAHELGIKLEESTSTY
ncbi:Ankyrin repeats (3 copies) [Pseudomonas putida]|nr:ankyrin repeat domain-containing protein [Pseudomonas sp. KHPS1]CAB5601564.1 Ankyrin repeats (3 copies) [Pseudomonas putida]UTH37255.1 ankyrin repeat domain-containing protein [Pseudomonas sp. KHPS1]CAB5676253.1 Ankyrin repeats (3 copies) [Pseudomonas putida]CAB5699043.1 Ankyrin repeats (3 copies) [Pseudomonas putida]CAC9681453.1 Ankyrin repeats (3 copies) [Pseudomonas putida]